MKKKLTLALTGLLVLSIVLATPYYVQKPVKVAAQQPAGHHWKIMLAQESCNAWIIGYLTYQDIKIAGTDFFLNCTCPTHEPPPLQPKGQFVFWKVWTLEIPTDIHYDKWIDVNKDNQPEEHYTIDRPIPYHPEPPNTVYEEVEQGTYPWPWMVVVEVREQPYNEKRPYFEWQIQMESKPNVTATLKGNLSRDCQTLPGTNFEVKTYLIVTEIQPPGEPTPPKVKIYDPIEMQCQVVKTPWCTVPNDISFDLYIDWYSDGTWDYDYHTPAPHLTFHQFPWTMTIYGPAGKVVKLELTEVYNYKYWIMGGILSSHGQLGGFAPWDPYPIGVGVPFATRWPNYTAYKATQNITFQQRDPITGIVKIGIINVTDPIDHWYYSPRVGTYFYVSLRVKEQGCGWIFTGQGKKPIFGDVDIITYNNNTGIYFENDPPPRNPINLFPWLEGLTGPDEIPGTHDAGDYFGTLPATPDLGGSSLSYLPGTLYVEYVEAGTGNIKVLFQAPWPMLMTTARAYDIVLEPESQINGKVSDETGRRWEFFAGYHRPQTPAGPVPWEHPRSNAYVNLAFAWSLLEIPTALGKLDIIYNGIEKKVRDDLVIMDVNDDNIVNILDVVKCAASFGQKDEGRGKKVADPKFNALVDVRAVRGDINILDLVKIASDFGKKLTSA